MESWLRVNPEYTIGKERKAYPDHRQKNTDGTKYGLRWWYTTAIPREIQGSDGRIQQGEDGLLTFLPFGIRIHGRRS